MRGPRRVCQNVWTAPGSNNTGNRQLPLEKSIRNHQRRINEAANYNCDSTTTHSTTTVVIEITIRLRYHYHRLLLHTGSTQQQLYTIQTYSEIIKHKKIKMTKSEHYSTILKKVSISHLLPYFYYSVLYSGHILMLVLIFQIAH